MRLMLGVVFALGCAKSGETSPVDTDADTDSDTDTDADT